MDVSMMFSALSLAPAVAKYMGVIEDKLATVEMKVDRLGNSEFEAGVRALLQAGDSDIERDTLLREARGRFNQAIGLEVGVRLVHAHLGLALCHKHLRDDQNMATALNALLAIPVPPAPAGGVASKVITDRVAKVPWWAKAAAIVAAHVLVVGVSVAGALIAAHAVRPGYVRWEAEVKHINELKERVACVLRDGSGDLPACTSS